MTIYFGILGIGFLAIIFILIKERKSSSSSAVDLLNNIDIDENHPKDEKKASEKISSSDFLKRLSLHNEDKNKKTGEETAAKNLEPLSTQPPPQDLEKKKETPQEPIDKNSSEQATP